MQTLMSHSLEILLFSIHIVALLRNRRWYRHANFLYEDIGKVAEVFKRYFYHSLFTLRGKLVLLNQDLQYLVVISLYKGSSSSAVQLVAS